MTTWAMPFLAASTISAEGKMRLEKNTAIVWFRKPWYCSCRSEGVPSTAEISLTAEIRSVMALSGERDAIPERSAGVPGTADSIVGGSGGGRTGIDEEEVAEGTGPEQGERERGG